MSIGIYALFWDNGLVYIGQSVEIEQRVRTHINNLQNNRHSNYKVQKAFNQYGPPQGVLLEVTDIDSLNYKEEQWQREFNSLESLDIVQAGIHHASGITNPRAKYSRKQLVYCFRVCRNPELTSKQVSIITKVSLAMVDDIRSGRAHKWLQEEFPYSWSIIQNTRSQRVTNGYKLSAKRLNKEYIFVSPEGKEYLVDNFAKFAKEHNLDASDLSRVASGKYAQTKGFKLRT